MARIASLARAGQSGRAARSRCSRPSSTTRSSARRSAAWRSPRTRSRARWCRRSRPAAASRAPASAPSSTCSSLEIEVDVNESYINRVTAGQPVTAVLDAYPDWQIPAHGDHDGADGRSAEGDGAGPHRLQRARSAHPARHGRQGHVPARGRRRGRRRRRSRCRWCRRARCAARTAASYVFVVRQDTVERRAVQTGGTDGDRLEVLAGSDGGRSRRGLAAGRARRRRARSSSSE